MNTHTAVRPEERRRRHVEGPGWADTVPTWFRSEAFAEDLSDAPGAPPRQPAQCMPPASDKPPELAASAG